MKLILIQILTNLISNQDDIPFISLTINLENIIEDEILSPIIHDKLINIINQTNNIESLNLTVNYKLQENANYEIMLYGNINTNFGIDYNYKSIYIQTKKETPITDKNKIINKINYLISQKNKLNSIQNYINNILTEHNINLENL